MKISSALLNHSLANSDNAQDRLAAAREKHRFCDSAATAIELSTAEAEAQLADESEEILTELASL